MRRRGTADPSRVSTYMVAPPPRASEPHNPSKPSMLSQRVYVHKHNIRKVLPSHGMGQPLNCASCRHPLAAR
eukprot:508511-Prymnesium_polylepis.1